MTDDKNRTLTDKIFKDTSGKIVLVQTPNLPLGLWVAASLVRLILHQNNLLSTGLYYLGLIGLVVWAVLELVYGVNYFRRALGAIVIGITVLAFIR